jgi:ABC-type antimicrobial peptide transport system permease subunit
VGVVEDVYSGTGAFGGGGQRSEMVYIAMGQYDDARFMSLAARPRGDMAGAAATLRRTVSGVDPDLPLYWVQTMEEALADTTFMHRIFGTIFAVFGGVALFMAAVGLYGVIDFSVSSRVREIGVRVALGADRSAVRRMVLVRVATQLAIGATVGVALGLLVAIPLSSTLFGVRRFDPLVITVIVVTLALTGLLAALTPTRRALRVDPVVALQA